MLGRLFGSQKSIDNAVQNVAHGLDALVFTKQEQADRHAAMIEKAGNLLLTWLDATQGQNLARRVLAFGIFGVWAVLYVSSATVAVVAVWMDNTAEWQNSAQIVGDYASQMDAPMMLIIGFYFAAPHLDKIIGPVLERWFGKKKSLEFSTTLRYSFGSSTYPPQPEPTAVPPRTISGLTNRPNSRTAFLVAASTTGGVYPRAHRSLQKSALSFL